MVSKIWRLLGKEISGLHEAAYLLGFFAVGSQVLALVRDRLLAHNFGAGASLDLYYAAFRVPDFLFATVASLVSASVLIPFFHERFKGGNEEGKHFVNLIFTIFVFVLLAVAAVAFILMPKIVPFVFPGFRDPQTEANLIVLSRLLLLSPIFLGLSNFLSSITQLHNRFFIYALSPVVYNVGIIFGIIFLTPTFGVKGIVYGVLLGAFLHMFIQLPFIISHGLLPRLVIVKNLKVAREVILVSLPRTIALTSNELSEFFLISIASLMSAGSISIFNFSLNLQAVPFSVIGVSYSLAAFPTLTKYFSSGDIEKYLNHIITSARHIIFLSMPVIALFVVLRAQIVRVVLGSGNFSWADTRLTAAALALFVVSIIPQSISLLLTRARYASGDTRKPLFINITASVFVIVSALFLKHVFATVPVFNEILAGIFRVSDVSGTDVLILPLAFSFGTTFGLICHIVSFQKDYPGMFYDAVVTFMQSLFSSLVLGIVAYVLLNIFDKIFVLNTFYGIFMQGFLAGIVGIAAAIIVLKLLGSRELADMWKTLHQKIWSAKVVGPDAEEVI